MNFDSVSSIIIPAGEVFSIHSGGTLLWSKPSPSPEPQLPPNNTIWYEAASQITSNIGSPVSHTFDSVTGRGVLTYDVDITTSTVVSNASFKSTGITKIWWPDCCRFWMNDCMHSCGGLTHIYAGSSLENISNGTCSGGCNSLVHIELLNNSYFYPNVTGLVKVSNKSLLLGTKNLDIRDTPCETIGSRCMADINVAGCTLYFPDTVQAFTGDYNIGSDVNPVFTAYFYSVVAPTASSRSNIRCGSGTTIHIPVGSLTSYQQAWSSLSGFTNMTFVEDL